MFEVVEDLDYMYHMDRYCTYNFRTLSRIKEKVGDEYFQKHFKLIISGIPLGKIQDLDGKIHKKIAYEFSASTRLVNESEEIEINSFIKKYILQFDKVLEEGYSLYFYGANDKGKTYTALLILAQLYKRRQKFFGHYITFREFCQLYDKSAWGETDEYAEFLVKSIMSEIPLIIVDEIGGKEGKATDNRLAIFEDLIKSRAGNNLPIIMIGNTKPIPDDEYDQSTSILTRYGESCFSAMTEKFRFFLFSNKKNPEFRIQQNKWDLDE